jgi:cell wall-associated NlpC family hydrolase
MLVLTLALFAVSPYNAVVVRPVANMYSRPTTEADVVSQAIYGSNVAVLEEQNAWSRVKTPDDYAGWIPDSDLYRSEEPYARDSKSVQVESLFANLYREPDVTRHQPIATVPFETRLEVIEQPDERWLQVRLPGGENAFIQRGDAGEPGRIMTAGETVAFSSRFLGLPYFWGGVSTFGYDCSGFTQMLCRRRGIMPPRDAGPQAHWTGVVPVTRRKLRPGDLLYFGKSTDKITHTGMYIGKGKFVHATAHLHPVVQVSKLRDPHWTELLVACRRLK